MHILINKVKYTLFTFLLFGSLYTVASQAPEKKEKEVFTHKELRYELRKDLRSKFNTKEILAALRQEEKEKLLQVKEWIRRKEQEIQMENAHRTKQQALLKTMQQDIFHNLHD